MPRVGEEGGGVTGHHELEEEEKDVGSSPTQPARPVAGSAPSLFVSWSASSAPPPTASLFVSWAQESWASVAEWQASGTYTVVGVGGIGAGHADRRRLRGAVTILTILTN